MKKSWCKIINDTWKSQPALWAIGLIFATAFVEHAFDWVFPSVSEKDEVFIEMARRLTGQADETVVARIKEQAISYLTEKLRLEYVTHNELVASEMMLSDIVATNVIELSKRIDAVVQLQDPDARYRQLLCDVGKATDGGHVPITSETCWDLMLKMDKILRDDKTLKAPHVASALLQLALRQGYPADEKRRMALKDITLNAMLYYEACPYKIQDEYSVYKAMTLLLYDSDKFAGFVVSQACSNSRFEQQMKDSRFLKESFFDSDFWPLKRR